MNTRVLFVEDEEPLRGLFQDVAREEGYEVEVASNADEAIRLLKKEDFQIIVTDVNMPGMSGIDLIPHCRRLRPDAVIIVVTGFSGNLDAVRAMNFGASMYLSKPLRVEELEEVLHTAEGMVQLRKDGGKIAAPASSSTSKKSAVKTNILAVSPVMTRILKQVELVAEYDVRVLVTGETGTGKELVARAIHEQSSRRTQPFVAINCAAIPADLLESELFGYERGAFSGAQTARKGYFEQANGGTLFLDEIGDMSYGLQPKLLRVLEEGKIQKLGSSGRPVGFDARIVSATSSDLQQLIREGRFREDLYYRLNDVVIDLPALRERREDIPILAAHWLGHFCATNSLTPKKISDEVINACTAYEWPGNVRQLQKAMIGAAVLSGRDAEVIRLEHLPAEVRAGAPEDASTPRVAAQPSLNQPIPAEGIDLSELMAEQEKQWLLKARQQAGGNQKRAAEMLLLPRSTYIEKTKRHHLDRESDS